LYNSCREDLRTERAINSDIRCEYFKDDKYGTCDVSIQGDKYSVRMPTEDLKLGKTSGAYWKVINQNGRNISFSKVIHSVFLQTTAKH